MKNLWSRSKRGRLALYTYIHIYIVHTYIQYIHAYLLTYIHTYVHTRLTSTLHSLKYTYKATLLYCTTFCMYVYNDASMSVCVGISSVCVGICRRRIPPSEWSCEGNSRTSRIWWSARMIHENSSRQTSLYIPLHIHTYIHTYIHKGPHG